MTLTSLWARLIAATLVPAMLVTALLLPIFNAQLDDRVDSTRGTAEALLTSGYEGLLQDMNESFNQVLATAEFPLLRRYMVSLQETMPLAGNIVLQRDREPLDALFNTLLTHFGRYTRLTLIDRQGRERLSVTKDSMLALPRMGDDSASNRFQEAMVLPRRALYVSPPRVETAGDGDAAVTTVIDIATPVFDQSGQRLGVMLFTLDWSHITANLLPAHGASAPQVLLADAQGTWLLADSDEDRMPFGGVLTTLWPVAWQAMSSRLGGEAVLDDHLLWFRTHDIRTNHAQSQAVMIMSEPETQPWQFGIVLPKPTLTSLLMESPGQLLAIGLVYLLSTAFGLYWALSHHRQRRLRQRALVFSRAVRQYAGEVQDLYENAPCGYHSLNSEGRIAKINRTELDWLGYRADEIIGKRDYRDFITPATRDAFEAAFQQVLGKAQEGAAECELLCRDGTTLPVAIQATAQVTDDGFQYSRATVFDLRERKQLEARLAKQAMSDSLTGLGNRRYLEDQAALEIARAQRSGAPLSLIAVDLDHFKRINDTHGHDGGDLVLQAFASTARQQLRDGDVLCRMGGEEFAILLPDTNREQALRIAERLREAVAITPVNVGQATTEKLALTYTASLGVTLVSASEETLKPAIKRADQGLYAAKETGRNRVQWEEA